MNDSYGDEQNVVSGYVSSSDAFRRKFCSQDRTRDKGSKVGWVEPRLYELPVSTERLLSSSTHTFDSGRERAGLRISRPVYCCVSDLSRRPDIHKSLRAIPLIAWQKLIRVSCLLQKRKLTKEVSKSWFQLICTVALTYFFAHIQSISLIGSWMQSSGLFQLLWTHCGNNYLTLNLETHCYAVNGNFMRCSKFLCFNAGRVVAKGVNTQRTRWPCENFDCYWQGVPPR